jgi:hypothetical protein
MNELTHYPTPLWISIAFLISIPLPFVLISRFVYLESKKIQNRSPFIVVVTFFTLYLIYIGLASFNGWFNHISLPPRVLLLTTFPFAFLLFMVVGKS